LNNVLLFVYGSMKKYFKNHYRLEKEKFIGQAVTVDDYAMYPSDMYMFPYVYENEKKNKINGELYKLINVNIEEIDIFEGSPVVYYRKNIKVICNNKIYEAFIYFRSGLNLTGIDTTLELKEWIKEIENVGIKYEEFLNAYIIAKQEAQKQFFK